MLADQISADQNNDFMNTENLSEDNLNRLAKALMLRHSVDYPTALAMLGTFRLNLICSDKLRTSKALQAALLTAVNAGKRAFHGGVFVNMPNDIICLLPWPDKATLNQIVHSLGGILSEGKLPPHGETLFLGAPSSDVVEGYVVHCSGWRGGITSRKVIPTFTHGPDFALGGIAAASIGVARCFLRISGLYFASEIEEQGMSLWRPDLNWLRPESDGPELEFLPTKLWMLGLGHLGQAYLWNFALLPYENPGDIEFMLQDFDRAVSGNYSAGLLCEEHNVRQKKARICADWLELRGFSTVITERRFDALTKRAPTEPLIACCGFDKAEPRMILEHAGFNLVVECGLGSDTYRFDRLILHTFPDGPKKPDEIWKAGPEAPPDVKLLEAFKQKDDCGIVAETLAKKAIASSFVGALAGSLVVAEILKGLHGGVRCDVIQSHLRHGGMPAVTLSKEDYQVRLARCGFASLMRNNLLAA
ncbi:MAG TPA: hypothetical protein VHG89_11960 [Verrucomicrobiae bacterium]|nr:hypothetical protein [Verrucomicrobiae bacterium]